MYHRGKTRLHLLTDFLMPSTVTGHVASLPGDGHEPRQHPHRGFQRDRGPAEAHG